jgi:hypothetical protein
MIPIPAGLVPWLLKHWDIILIGVAVAALVGYIYHKGAESVENDTAEAVVEHNETSRKEIINTEKKYDAPLNQLNSKTGGDAPAGPLTAYALERMPRPPRHR